MSVNQTVAIFKDTYREIHSKKMFWITLGLTVLGVLIFSVLGVGRDGLTVLWYTVFPMERAQAEVVYKGVFSNMVVGFGLTWACTIMALISTSFIFPDFLSAGAIDLYMSKPIGRWRLFLTKYMAGMLFVVLQVGVFCAGSFLVLGIRGGAWQPGIFLGIPIVVCFFSYLYAFSVLFGVWTRSTIAAVLLTILVWGGLFAVGFAEGKNLEIIHRYEATAKGGDVAQIEMQMRRLEGAQVPEMQKKQLMRMLAEAKVEAERQAQEMSSGDGLRKWRSVHGVLLGLKTVLPKTTETTNLLDRILFSREEAEGVGEMKEVNRLTGRAGWEEELRERSVWWIVGTSLLFEALVVGLAGWIFVRRDY